MRKILLFICVLFISTPAYSAVDVGDDWGFYGDSQTDDEAADSPRWITMIAPDSVSSYWNGGLSASALTYGIDRYEAYTDNGDLTWVHFQESGNQNYTSQNTASAFGDTFDDAVESIETNSPNAIISYETAFSFGREAESYRDWTTYNTELRDRIDDFEAAGTTVILVETDANIKALQTEISDAGEVWCQSDEGCAYHYKDLGNLMVALSVWSALGYTESDLDLTDSEITALDSDHVDAALAIAFDDAKYVATTGCSDSTSYDLNSLDDPWCSIAHAWETAEDGDTIYYRAGTYTITTSIDTEGYADNVTHMAYPGESVTWNGMSNGDSSIFLESSGVTVSGLTINSYADGGDNGFFRLGWNTGDSDNFTVEDCTVNIDISNTGGNTGFIAVRQPNSGEITGLTVRNCTITGDSVGTNSNAGGIHTFQLEGALIENNVFDGFYNGMFFNKHSQNCSDTTTVIRNNVFKNCHNGLQTMTVYSEISNNLFINNETDLVTGADGGDGGCGQGSDYNTIDHNTFTGTVEFVRGGSEDPGATYNTFTNNIIEGWFYPHRYTSSWSTTYVGPDYNLYSTGDIIRENGIDYTLSEWQSHIDSNSSDYEDDDNNSIAGSPTYEGGGSPVTIDDYALTAASNGYQDAGDGEDIGADVSLVGVGVESGVNVSLGTGPTLTIGSGSTVTIQ